MISARGLARRFGERQALRPLELELPEGGFLVVSGPNGSGKSTLLALLAGLLAPTAGTVEIRAERHEIGYLAHEPLLYRELTALENLDLYGRLYRLPKRRERSEALLAQFALWELRHQRVSTLSRGMLQRLALCRTLLHQPRLALLDEPAAGLDGVGQALLDTELTRLRSQATVVVASHEPERLSPLATGCLALAATASGRGR